jgi:hypothetical protein
MGQSVGERRIMAATCTHAKARPGKRFAASRSRTLSELRRHHHVGHGTVSFEDLSKNMNTLAAYLISVGIVVFGIWTFAVAANAATGSFLAWAFLSLLAVTVGILSLLLEMRNHTAL